MEESTVEIIFLVIGCIGIIIAVFAYNGNPDLHKCGACGKYLDIKAKRVWYETEGKKVPFCVKCDRKHSG